MMVPGCHVDEGDYGDDGEDWECLFWIKIWCQLWKSNQLCKHLCHYFINGGVFWQTDQWRKISCCFLSTMNTVSPNSGTWFKRMYNRHSRFTIIIETFVFHHHHHHHLWENKHPGPESGNAVLFDEGGDA